MDIKSVLSKERVVNGLMGIGKLRIKISHTAILTYSALALILFIAFTMRLFPMRWEIQTGALHLSEFDPYFQYRFTEYIVKNGFFSWASPPGWIDTQRWYPDGINVAKAAYPGLPMTTAFFYRIVTALGLNIPLMDFCAVFAPIMATLTCFAIYFVGKDIGGRTMGLLASLFLALNPSHIQRTGLGFFDDETVGLFALMIFIFMFLRSIESDRPIKSTMKYALGSGLALGYFCAGWGAAYYPIGVVTLFVFVSLLLKRYTQRLLLTYSVTFGIGLFMAINVPKQSAAFLTTSAILPVAGVFLLLCLAETFRNVTSTKWRVTTTAIFLALIIGGFAVLWQTGFMRGVAGKFASVIDPFLRGGSPLIESVAEHRISAWGSIYYEFGITIVFFITGLYFVLRNLNNKNLFLLIYGITALYFASSMVRLLVLLAPAFGLLSAAGIAGILKPFNTLLREPPRINLKKKLGLDVVGKEFSGIAVLMIFLILMTNFAFPMPKVYRQAYTPITITASSLPIAPGEPVPEWLDVLQWTKNNLNAGTVVASWWDYGYWLTVLGNVTSLTDNATVNTTQIENLGFIFMANEVRALNMCRKYNVQYVLVFATFDANGKWYDGGGGDNGKWTWMARISGKASDRFIEQGLLKEDVAWVNETTFGSFNQTWNWNEAGRNSTIYKLMSWGKNQWCEGKVTDPDAGNVTKPTYFDEAYFSGKTLSSDDSQNKYGGIVPLVCLYKINWDKYYSENPSP